MAFLDSFKKHELAYITILTIGVVVLFVNNVLQFLDYMLRNKWLSLLSLVLFILFWIFNFKNKKEVFR